MASPALGRGDCKFYRIASPSFTESAIWNSPFVSVCPAGPDLCGMFSPGSSSTNISVTAHRAAGTSVSLWSAPDEGLGGMGDSSHPVSLGRPPGRPPGRDVGSCSWCVTALLGWAILMDP